MRRLLLAAVLLVTLILAFVLGYLFNPRQALPPPADTVPPTGPPPPSLVAEEPASCAATGLLRPTDFDGTWEGKSLPAPTGAMSTFNGMVALTNADRAIVAEVLPAAWTLAAPLVEQGCHPILILYGHQTNLQLFPPTFSLLFPTSQEANEYVEVMVLIPFVQRLAGGSNMHTFVARMYLNDAVAMFFGNKYYGYAKELAEFSETASTFDVLKNVTLGSTTITVSMFEAQSMNPGMWQDAPAATIPSLPAIQEILEMPLVGMKWDLTAAKFIDQCSFFEMDYAAKPAQVRTVDVEHRYVNPLASGMSKWPTLGTLASVPGGAIEVTGLDWRLRFPVTPFCVYKP